MGHGNIAGIRQADLGRGDAELCLDLERDNSGASVHL